MKVICLILLLLAWTASLADTPVPEPSPSPSPRKLDLYTLPSDRPDMFRGYEDGQKEYNKRKAEKSPLLSPPTNLAPGDSDQTIATKIATSRVAIIQNAVTDQAKAAGMQYVPSSVKHIQDDFKKLSDKVSKVTTQSLNTKTSVCDLKSTAKYDTNSNTATMLSTCETYNARFTYSVFSTAYEVNLFKQLDNTNKIGIKTSDISHTGIVFLEGSW